MTRRVPSSTRARSRTTLTALLAVLIGAAALVVGTSGSAISAADGWWDTAWSHRAPVTVSPRDVERHDAVVEVPVDFDALFAADRSPGAVDPDTIRLIEHDGAGRQVGQPLVGQFDPATPGANHGTLIFVLPGTTPAGATRQAMMYFDHPSKALALHARQDFDLQSGFVTVSDSTDEGRAAFRIATPRVEWYFLKSGGAFSSAVDPDGRDWIGFHPTPGSQFNGEYRGIGQLDDNWFHPGGTQASTVLISDGPNKVTLQSTANVASGTWVQRVEIYPTFVRSTFLQTGTTPWWFLYEGTPGGESYFNGGTGTITLSNGQSVPFSGNFSVDLPANGWVNFAVPSQNRSIFFSHGQADGEEGYHSAGAMTVFGFGRSYPGDTNKINPGAATQTFLYGILNTADAGAAGSQIAAIQSASDGNIDTGGGAPPTTQPPSPAARFQPVTPARLLDTRLSGQGPALSANTPRSLTVRNVAGVPNNADAVVLNVTATGASQATFVRVWPSGSTMPSTSSLNVDAQDTVPNLVTTAVGSGGAIDLMISDGTADLIVDVVGYYAASLTTGGYHAVNPVRALDTREGAGAAVGPQGTVDVDVAAALGLNAANVAGVALNVTVTTPSEGGFVAVYPASGALPLVSNLNFRGGQTVANAVVVGANAGKVTVYNAAGSAHVVVDIVGWYETGTGGARFHSVSPRRAFDTRDSAGRTPVAGGTAVDGVVTGSSLGVETNAVAVVANITVTEATDAAFITAWPTGEARPLASMQNTVGGTTRANQAITKVGTGGAISVFNSTGSVHVVADVVGYFN